MPRGAVRILVWYLQVDPRGLVLSVECRMRPHRRVASSQLLEQHTYTPTHTRRPGFLQGILAFNPLTWPQLDRNCAIIQTA